MLFILLFNHLHMELTGIQMKFLYLLILSSRLRNNERVNNCSGAKKSEF